MEMEYHDDTRRSRVIIIVGIILALLAGGGAFYLVNQAQQQAQVVETPKATVVVAARAIAARKVIEEADLATREIDQALVVEGTITDSAAAIGRIAAVNVVTGQIMNVGLLLSTEPGAQFSVLKPGEPFDEKTPFWRAVAVTVPDERAVGGLVNPGMAVDLFATILVTPPITGTGAAVPTAGGGALIAAPSTKLVFENVEILARVAGSYIIRVDLPIAEEIEHLVATGGAQFSMALRPPQDTRTRLPDTKLGSTTNLIITRYGLPFDSELSATNPNRGSTTPTPLSTPQPIPSASPSPSPAQ